MALICFGIPAHMGYFFYTKTEGVYCSPFFLRQLNLLLKHIVSLMEYYWMCLYLSCFLTVVYLFNGLEFLFVNCTIKKINCLLILGFIL